MFFRYCVLAGWIVGAVALPVVGDVFYEDFSGTMLDGNWLIAEKAWGGDNGGVVHDNVVLQDGLLQLIGHGNAYTGTVQGVNHDGARIDRVTKVGASIATRDYYASGRYEVRARLPEQLGSCSAFWTFHYEEGYKGTELYDELAALGGVSKTDFSELGLSGMQVDALWADISTTNAGGREAYLVDISNDTAKVSAYFKAHVWDVSKLDVADDFGCRDGIYRVLKNGVSLEVQGSDYAGYYIVRNHEIDIEMPTSLKATPTAISYTNARFNSWVGEFGGEYTDPFVSLGHGYNDNEFHTFRFDWHTGSTTEVPRVEYYVDETCFQTNYTSIPTIAGRFWLGLWFPAWTGIPEFEQQSLDIDWVRVTPFEESGDAWVPESYPDSGWWTNQVTTNHCVPLWWLAQYGWTNDWDAAAEGDQDADGYATWQEWVTDTNPTNAQSRLQFDGTLSDNLLTLDWNASASDRVYSLEQTDAVSAGFSNTLTVVSNGVSAWTTAVPSSVSFYRVCVELDEK